jgi:ankyrin repeat protein
LVVISSSTDKKRVYSHSLRCIVSQAGYTALHLAAEAGLPHVIAALLAAAPSLYGPSNNLALRLTAAGSTALHLAVTSGVRDCVELLLSDDPAESNTPDSVSD